LDPQVIVQSSTGQLQDLVARIRERSSRNERVLVTCITKDSAEKLTDYLLGEGVRSRYIHSDVEVVERIELVRELRLGMYDVLVGVNLLREGIDMPEVSLVAVMDADTQGFLRSETALIQTIGRAARHINGTAVLYAQNTTEAMRKAIEETDRRRSLQAAHNTKHGIVPVGVSSGIRDNLLPGAAKKASNVRGSGQAPGVVSDWDELDDDALKRLLLETEERMLVESALLRFEEAAAMRDKAEVIARRLAQGS
jgi:excinuclease ABC subunit B